MESLKTELWDTITLDNWYRHYHNLETFLQQNNPEPAAPLLDLDADLVKWISIQAKIRNKLPAELKTKLSALNFDFNPKNIAWELHYQQLVQFVRKNGHTRLPENEPALEALRDWLLKQIQSKKYLSESRFQKLDSLGVDWELVITRDQRWEYMYLKLKAFYQQFGHSQVPQNWENDKALANWVRVQRRMKAQHKLRADREQQLNTLKFVWHIQEVYDSSWQHFYEELRLFYQKHGHCRVPGHHKQLTSWLENQRTAKKNKVLSAKREKQLNDLGFIWSFEDIKKTAWHEKYAQLAAFKKNQGHCFVPVNYKENKSLGIWVASQRKLEAQGKLEKDKKKKLSKLGFVWSAQTQQQLQTIHESQWKLSFERLKIYHQVYGTCQVSLKINPVLQRWTRWQRKLFYQGKLSEERMAKLNEIRFPWNIQEGYWMKMYEALADFKNQFGHTRVPYQWPQNRQLAAWVYRLKLNKNELTAQKIELLQILGFDWSLSRKTVVSWEDMYQRLRQFKQQYGHTRVPVKWQPDLKLGKWVSRMRQEKEKLLPERARLLNQIDFNWGTPVDSKKTNYSGKTKEGMVE